MVSIVSDDGLKSYSSRDMVDADWGRPFPKNAFTVATKLESVPIKTLMSVLGPSAIKDQFGGNVVAESPNSQRIHFYSGGDVHVVLYRSSAPAEIKEACEWSERIVKAAAASQKKS